MDLKLTGKVALVTGSTAGIGFSIAQSLASEGALVYVNGRTRPRVDAAIAAIRSHASVVKVDGIAADFSGSAGADAVIAKLPAVDVLVNNVGIFEPKPFCEIPDADWYRFFEINVMSGVRLARHYLTGMLKKNWGRVIFISSESGVQIPAEMVHYGVTKTAQIAVARGIAESVAGTGVTVNSILAGPTESEGVVGFVEAMARQQKKSKSEVEKEFFEHVRPLSLLKRFATVDENRINGDLPGWRAFFRHKRRSTASGWWRREGDSLSEAECSRSYLDPTDKYVQTERTRRTRHRHVGFLDFRQSSVLVRALKRQMNNLMSEKVALALSSPGAYSRS